MDGTFNEIIQKIDQHLSNSGKSYYNEFYVGITNDPKRRLFEEHGVSKEDSWWIYVKADNAEIARNVEKHYLNEGMRGNDGGGNEDSCYVYCYAVTQTTVDR